MTNTKPTVLETFTCIGGSALGYAKAGFRVLGVDYEDYSIPFNKGALQAPEPADMVWAGVLQWDEALDKYIDQVDVLHASPPCQHYSRMSGSRPGLSETYPDMVAAVRTAFQATGKPWVIENVENSPLDPHITTCGWTMGREVYQHHWWEVGGGLHLVEQPHRKHVTPASKAGHWVPGTFVSVAGHCSPIELCRRVMEIDWCNRDGLAEACPPYMAEFIGRQIMETL